MASKMHDLFKIDNADNTIKQGITIMKQFISNVDILNNNNIFNIISNEDDYDIDSELYYVFTISIYQNLPCGYDYYDDAEIFWLELDSLISLYNSIQNKILAELDHDNDSGQIIFKIIEQAEPILSLLFNIIITNII